MFTGIIESLGQVKKLQKEGSNLHLTIASEISSQLKVDQSVSHNGVCLTVTKVGDGEHVVTAVDETLKRSTLGFLKAGDLVNLERCMAANGRFDGHIVQGHVDQTGICVEVRELNGSWLFDFSYEPGQGNITVEKGSICINGVSLTSFNSKSNGFTVTIIPYTFEHTNFKSLKVGDIVNLEFDVIGKYVQKILGK
ncbi:MAG: riboflavin synthase [Cyclobacteriaceae bacterium]